jgi:hypothetical protein
MRQPTDKSPFEDEILRYQVFADGFRAVCGVLEKFFTIAEKTPSAKPICSGRRPLEPDRVAKNDRPKRDYAGYRIAE